MFSYRLLEAFSSLKGNGGGMGQGEKGAQGKLVGVKGGFIAVRIYFIREESIKKYKVLNITKKKMHS